jgi:hypothetical protein
MLEKLATFLAATALSILLIPVAIALTTLLLLLLSFPFRLFRATRQPSTAVGIPTFILAIWTIWYGEVGFFRVLLQYAFASMIAIAILDVRDRNKKERKDARAIGATIDVTPTVALRRAPAPVLSSQPSDREIVNRCLAEADEARKELGAHPATLGLPPEMMETVNRLLNDAPRTVHTVRVDCVSPRNLVWLLISNVAGDMLACGEHHIYRGVLSMSGKALQSAYLRAVDELQESGFHDAEAAARDRTWLRSRIAEAG